MPRWTIAAIAVAALAVGIGGTLVATGGDDDSEEPATAPSETVEPDSSATTEPEEVEEEPPPAPPGPPTCDELKADLSEGLCQRESGDEYIVANRDSELDLKELKARIVDIETADVLTDVGVTRANGTFLIFTLDITNELPSPVQFSESQEQTYFAIGTNSRNGAVYTEDFDAENGGDEQSFAWQFEEIQPGTTQRGTVIFDVPPEAIQELEKTGNLGILNFSDADRARPRLPIGAFRTYGD